MRNILVSVLMAVIIVGGSSAALAKGARSATIDGGGLPGPIDVNAGSAGGDGFGLVRLAEAAGFFPAVFGQRPDPLIERPSGELGPRFVITWLMPGPTESSSIVQYLYPLAEAGAVTFTPADQDYLGPGTSVGGWYKGGLKLSKVLVDLGMPESATTTLTPQSRTSGDRSSSSSVPAVTLIAGLVGLAGGFGLFLRSRRTATT